MHSTPSALKLLEELVPPSWGEASAVDRAEVWLDVQLMYKLYDLQKLVRFFGQNHWEEETERFGRYPSSLKLENVAAHSYHVARAAMLLAPHFPWLDGAHAIKLALIHDEPEVVTGDKDPVGEDGQGTATHAFNKGKRKQKDEEERNAAEILAAGMRPSLRFPYQRLTNELIEDRSDEARYVRALDKLQSLTFVRLTKGGMITPEHAAFTIRYSRSGLERFPPLAGHFQQVLRDLLDDVIRCRGEAFEGFCSTTLNKVKEAERT